MNATEGTTEGTKEGEILADGRIKNKYQRFYKNI